jgi:hypothetical protein
MHAWKLLVSQTLTGKRTVDIVDEGFNLTIRAVQPPDSTIRWLAEEYCPRGANLRARTGSVSGVTGVDVEDMACGPQMVNKDGTKAETQLSANPS